jgi:hypothetical protein
VDQRRHLRATNNQQSATIKHQTASQSGNKQQVKQPPAALRWLSSKDNEQNTRKIPRRNTVLKLRKCVLGERSSALGRESNGTWVREQRHLGERTTALGRKSKGTWVREQRHLGERTTALGRKSKGTWVREQRHLGERTTALG